MKGFCLVFVVQVYVRMSSSATEPLGPRGRWQRVLPSRCRTLEVNICSHTYTFTQISSDISGKVTIVFCCFGLLCACFSHPTIQKPLCRSVLTYYCLCLLSTAMSSYLYIVKYEFPLVIQAFLKVDKPAG